MQICLPLTNASDWFLAVLTALNLLSAIIVVKLQSDVWKKQADK